MQNKSAKNSINFFHRLVQLGKIAIIINLVITILSLFFAPDYIEIPILFEVDNAGYIQYENPEKFAVDIKIAKGEVIYSKERPNYTTLAITNILFGILFIAMNFFIYYLLEKIIRNTKQKKPFSLANGNYMNWIGYTFIALGILRMINRILGLIILKDGFSSDFISIISPSIQFFTYFIGLVLNEEVLIGLFAILVAQILKYGIELKEENALTI